MTRKPTAAKTGAKRVTRSGRPARRKPLKARQLTATADELTGFYRQMLLMRRFEEKAGQLYGMGLIGGFCHLYIGQEAVVSGIQSTLKDGDTILTSYRDHAHMLACGIKPELIMAELTGRAAGISGGKGGSMHMFSVDHGFYGGHGIVAAQVPIGTGLGFAHKYRETDNVSVVYFGDGASNQGQIYESFNMAELWGLPVIFVIENNKYAMGTAIKRASSEVELHRRGESFRIPGEAVDGMDVLAVREAAQRAVDWCRAGNGPILLEMNTYRYRGHSMSDPAKYRSKEEVQKMRADHDPIDQVKQRLLADNIMSEDDMKAMDKGIKATIADAVKFAQECPEPDSAALYRDVLVAASRKEIT
ncbi:MAG: pyruvate dehydrogenase (acetyl-transferring) E1 component subunit alpha [Alphaproteobacteria bacterium]|nr:pyruvate dehydrogenase (acetyl-transferring) E1 component subunit alpha [Alphaproteobacteria bacterium]